MARNDEHQPVMVKAVYADGTAFYYDSALHAHATHFDGSPVVSIDRCPDDEEQRVEQGGPVPASSGRTGQQVAFAASVATDEETTAKDTRIAELEAELAAARAG
jgi:phage baseplate assembly protein gpV